MNGLNGFVLDGGRALYRPVGNVTFKEVAALVLAAIAAARSSAARDLLVDTTALTGFPSPDTFERFVEVVKWAGEARGEMRLALVARPEMIDPMKLEVRVAASRDLVSNIFTTEDEARAWLDARTAGEGDADRLRK
jgi:hypothetical protein